MGFKWDTASFALAIFYLIFFISGCAVNRRALLEDSVNSYVKALRLGDENVALSYVNPEKRTEFYKNSLKIESLHISQAEVKTIFPDEKSESALVTILLEYFPQSGVSIVTERHSLMWKYNEKAQAWLLNETTPFGN